MYIKIAPNIIREPQWNCLIGENVYVSILKYTPFIEHIGGPEGEDINKIQILLQISTENSRDTRGKTPSIPNVVVINEPTDKYWLTSLYNEVATILRTKLEETDENVKVEVADKWETTFGANLNLPRPIRLTVPKDLLITSYEPLMSKVKQGWREDGVNDADFPFFFNEDSVTVYFADLGNATVDELAMIQNDANVIIEQNV